MGKVILGTPRSRWLSCMHSQTEERILKQSLFTAKTERDKYRTQLVNLWAELDKKKDRDDIVGSTSWKTVHFNALLTVFVCLWVFCRDCCCGWCWRRKVATANDPPSNGRRDLELAPPQEIADWEKLQ